MALRKTADLFSCEGWEGDSTGGQSGLASEHLRREGGAALPHSCLRTFAPAIPATQNISSLEQPSSHYGHKG